MELYVHIPFCRKKCLYCDFASFPGMETEMESYVDCVLREADERIAFLGDRTCTTVYIGGGTPSVLPAALLERLLLGLQERFHISEGAEFTAEANPGTLTDQWLRTATAHGVNRISLGMQSAQPELLRMLGRIHSMEDVYASADMVRRAGIPEMNLDLMFGLPRQTPAMWEATLREAVALHPEHLSCYGLIPEEGTKMKELLDSGALSLPDEETEREMYDYTISFLADCGYQQYEISNFAQKGKQCRHNVGYWRQVPYLGLGVAAASMYPDVSGEAAYYRTTNPSSVPLYKAMVQGDAVRQEEPVSQREAMFETLMLGFRMNEGISETGFLQMHGVTLDSYRGERLREQEKLGLLEHDGGYWRLTRKGMDIQNTVLVNLMD